MAFSNGIETIVSVCSMITSIAAVVAVVKSSVARAQAPNKEQNLRLDNLELEIEKINSIIGKDEKRLDNIEVSNMVTQKALLALVQHSIDGNNIAQLKEVKADIENFLITGKGVC